MTSQTTLADVLDRLLQPGAGRPASEGDFHQMAQVAPMPAELRSLYRRDAEVFVPGFELFEPAIYVDVNARRDGFGELAEMIFIAEDQASGFYFIDAGDLLGLGPGFVYWVDRARMDADAVVPVAPSLGETLARLERGEIPNLEPTLGQRAIARLAGALDDPPPGVDANPPVQRAAFAQAREARGLILTMATGDVLLLANGINFPTTGQQIHALEHMTPAAGGGIAIVGHDPALGFLGVTRGDWQNLPADRLIAFGDIDHPERGQLLGRFADVVAFWIEEARAQ